MIPEQFDESFYEARVTQKNPTSDNPEMTSLVNRIEHWCRIKDGDRVLDFGCYDGYILRRLRSRRQITGVGVDIASAAVKEAQRLNRSSDLEFIVSDGVPLPFKAASFDVVVCSEILEHVPDLDETLAELARVLAPGGRLYATMPNSLNDVWRPFHRLCRRIDVIEGHLRRMTRTDFLATVASHGFKPLQAQYRGFVLSAVWYETLIYSPRVKTLGLAFIGADKSLSQRLAKRIAYAAMRVYLFGDRPFSQYRRSMGIDAAFQRMAQSI